MGKRGGHISVELIITQTLGKDLVIAWTYANSTQNKGFL